MLLWSYWEYEGCSKNLFLIPLQWRAPFLHLYKRQHPSLSPGPRTQNSQDEDEAREEDSRCRLFLCKEQNRGNQESWGVAAALALASCVTLCRYLNLSDPYWILSTRRKVEFLYIVIHRWHFPRPPKDAWNRGQYQTLYILFSPLQMHTHDKVKN